MKAQKFTLFVFLLTVTLFEAEAQSFYSYRRDRDFLITVGSGTTNYFGRNGKPRILGYTQTQCDHWS